MVVADATARLMAWLPIPLQELEPCIPSRKAQHKQARTWFSKVELPALAHDIRGLLALLGWQGCLKVEISYPSGR